MTLPDAETNDLVARARSGDGVARRALLERHRPRLRRMIAVRLDQRLRARLDPSDVVQEVFADAWTRLDAYLLDVPLPFYPWLRQLAWQRLVKLHQHHLRAKKRAVTREHSWAIPLSDDALAAWLPAGQTSPSGRAIRAEMRVRVNDALARLPARDREILVMKYLEGLSTRETAEALHISEGAAKVRHFRALERIRGFLGDPAAEECR